MNLQEYSPTYLGEQEDPRDEYYRDEYLYSGDRYSGKNYYGDLSFEEKIDEYYSEIDSNSELEAISEVGSVSFGASYNSGGINFKKPQKRTTKTITNKDELKEILSIDHFKAAEKSTIMDLFANFGDGPRYEPYYLIEIPPHYYGGLSKTNKEFPSSHKTNNSKFTTTIGLWIFNKAFIEPMSDILGYINEPITGDVYDSLNKKVSYALLEDKITVKQLKDFIMQSQIMMSCCSALASSHTETMFTMEQQISKKKEELKKKYGDKIKENDLIASKEYENELIKYTKDLLKDDPAVDMFNSGARSSWGNNVKNMYILRGPQKGTDGSYKFVDSSYIEGMDPKDFKVIADASVGGPFSRSRKTASGGYIERLVQMSTSHLKILPKGSDCGSDKYIEVELNKSNIKDWYFSNMIEGSKLVELTPENASKYIDKTVKLRFSALCKSKNGICEACAGTLFNRIGLTNVGVATSIMASSMKNKAMKAYGLYQDNISG